MKRATLCAAAAAGLLMIAAPGAARASMPVNNGIAAAPGGGMMQTVRWHSRHHWRRWHRHRSCWVSRRVFWRHGHRVVTRVRHCGWRS